MAKFQPEIKTCSFVDASDLFKGMAKLWNALTSIDNLPFTWGSNNRSMVVAQDIYDALEQHEIDVSEALMKMFADRCEIVGWQTYVDLES